MSRTLVLLLCLAAGCGSKVPDSRVIRSMQLNEGKPSYITFESAYAKGTIEIAADVKIDYKSSTDSAGVSKSLITIDGKVLEFDGPELLIGGEKKGKLEGPISILIGAPGVVFRDVPSPR